MPKADGAEGECVMAEGAQINGFLRVSQIVPGILPVARSTFFKWVSEGKAPQPIKISKGITVWRASEIANFVEQLQTPKEAA